MKKSHYKKAIDKLFEQWPWEHGFDPERNITSILIEPAQSEDEFDTDIYVNLTIHCIPDDFRYGHPKVLSVSFNLSKK